MWCIFQPEAFFRHLVTVWLMFWKARIDRRYEFCSTMLLAWYLSYRSFAHTRGVFVSVKQGLTHTKSHFYFCLRSFFLVFSLHAFVVFLHPFLWIFSRDGLTKLALWWIERHRGCSSAFCSEHAWIHFCNLWPTAGVKTVEEFKDEAADMTFFLFLF